MGFKARYDSQGLSAGFGESGKFEDILEFNANVAIDRCFKRNLDIPLFTSVGHITEEMLPIPAADTQPAPALALY